MTAFYPPCAVFRLAPCAESRLQVAQHPDLVLASDGSMRVFFGGLSTPANSALNTPTAPATGATRSLQAGKAAQDTTAYASPSGADTTKDGTPVSAWATTFGTRDGAKAPAITIKARGAQDVNIASAPGGRLWLMWQRGGLIYVTRTNAAATKAGPVHSVKPPAKTSTIWKLSGEGSRAGVLDLLASVSTPGSLATWHTQVKP
jgi:hypothetical protein